MIYATTRRQVVLKLARALGMTEYRMKKMIVREDTDYDDGVRIGLIELSDGSLIDYRLEKK